MTVEGMEFCVRLSKNVDGWMKNSKPLNNNINKYMCGFCSMNDRLKVQESLRFFTKKQSCIFNEVNKFTFHKTLSDEQFE